MKTAVRHMLLVLFLATSLSLPAAAEECPDLVASAAIIVPVSEPSLAGLWSGDFVLREAIGYACSNVPFIDQTCTLTLDLTQVDQNLQGRFTMGNIHTIRSNGAGGCIVGEQSTRGGFAGGTASGNSMSGFLVLGQAAEEGFGRVVGFTASVEGGNILRGTFAGPPPGTTGTFELRRIASPNLPRVDAFRPTQFLIRPGARTTLIWNTTNASGVSIDNGIGAQPPDGSITVSPSTSTNYVLTAVGPGGTVTQRTHVEVLTGPAVQVESLPRPMIQPVDTGGATTSYVLRNIGGGPTTLTLRQLGAFFTQSPATFTLAPGARQKVTITGLPRAEGAFDGVSIPEGPGVPPRSGARIRMLSAPLPAGSTRASAIGTRIDVKAPRDQNPSGKVTFKNSGTAAILGVLVADVPWIVPQAEPVRIAPGGTAEANFVIDRSLRPDAASPSGSQTGRLGIHYRTGTVNKSAPSPHDAHGTSSSSVSVVDSAQPPVSQTQIPSLGADEVAFFVPGVGHVTGTVGTFISDLSITNLSGEDSIEGLKLYYTPAGNEPSTQSLLTSLSTVSANQSVMIADIANSVFSAQEQIASLQIRTTRPDDISINANIFNASNPAGTLGTVIPIFRSDRSVAAGSTVYLTGLRNDASSHTNLYFQETAGGTVAVQTEFFDAAGNPVGTRSDSVSPYRLQPVTNPVPDGAVSAAMTATESTTGRFLAYATPVDDDSGDTWAVADWNLQFASSRSDAVLIPVAGTTHGINDTYFRTDLAILNTTEAQATGTLRYFPRAGGSPLERAVSLNRKQTSVISDVVGSYFGVTVDDVGFVTFTPSAGSFAVTSRTYATVGGEPATLGTGAPSLPLASSLRLGDFRRISGLEDAAQKTIEEKTPATFRTNFALLETSGNAATIRVTLSYPIASGRVELPGNASKDYVLGAYQFQLLNNVSREIIGAERDTSFGDLTNLQVEFAVIQGDGAVSVFTSSIDNGTGDSILRTE